MVKINGIETDCKGLTIAELLSNNSYDVKRVAVELNGELITKAKYDSTILECGDCVEIVTFVGGG